MNDERHERPRLDGRRRTGQAGYNLVALAVAITVLNILVAAAMPMWSTAMQREKEEELIFRGLQYAQGVYLFQRRFGRLPVRLEEMIEVQPRCLRQLWKDPMTDSGKWGIIFANSPSQGRGGQSPPGQRPPGQTPPGQTPPGQAPPGQTPPGQTPPGQTPPGQNPPGQATDFGLPAPGQEGEETVTVGPIVGVRSLSTEESLLEFNGQTTYDAWQFTVGMVTGSVGLPGQPGGVPSLSVRWVGRPLRKGIQAPPGGVPAELRDNPNLDNRRQGPGENQGGAPDASGTQRPRRRLPNTLGGGQGSQGGRRP